MESHRYFVVYAYESIKHGTGIGNTCIISTPIESYEVIRQVEEAILASDRKFKRVVLLNYRKLED